MRQSQPFLQPPKADRPRPRLLDVVTHVFPEYQAAQVHQTIAERLEWFLAACEAELSPRLLIQVPPRHGKSELASVWLPAYIFGLHPDWPIIHTSYSADLSNDFSRRVQGVLLDERYQELFPGVVPAKNSRAVKRWGIEGRRGYFVSTGVGGPITGRGTRCLIIDDPTKNRQDADSATIQKVQRDWYSSTAYTRLEKGAGVLLIMTRWNLADLGGYVTTGVGADTPPADAARWQVLTLPAVAEANDALGRPIGAALWPEKYGTEYLDLVRGTLSTRDWLALYQQRPVADSGNLLEVDRIVHCILPEEKRRALKVYQAWDLAISEKATADYTVCATLGVDSDKNVYLLDIVRRRLGFHETLLRFGEQAAVYAPGQIAIESVGYQSAAFQEAVRRYLLPFREVKPEKDKATRAQLLAARISAGKVFADRSAPWWRAFEEEAKSFPVGEHDDQVDAVVYALFLITGGKWWEDPELIQWLKDFNTTKPAESPKEAVEGNAFLTFAGQR